MEIKGKVHCFFEQSGTFKNEFIKLGIPAEDYDIQNNFGETEPMMENPACLMAFLKMIWLWLSFRVSISLVLVKCYLDGTQRIIENLILNQSRMK